MTTKIQRLRARLLANATGGAAVEFALLAPMFCALTVGVFQSGLYVEKYNAL